MSVAVAFMRLPENPDLPLPHYASTGAAGFDLRAAAGTTLAPGEIALVPTGFAVAVPEHHELQIRPRSGLAAKHGVTVLNAPGTIDSDYRGPLMILLINLGREPFVIARGDRIAQGIVAVARQAGIVEAGSLDETSRGSGGFGSTGRL